MQFQAQCRGYAAEYPDAEPRIILADDEPVGRILVHRTEGAMRLVDIAILPEQRNRGVGTTFLRDLIAESESTGRPLKLQVAKGNRAARLYERVQPNANVISNATPLKRKRVCFHGANRDLNCCVFMTSSLRALLVHLANRNC
jgi:ribosomal protein S18 acetylase RimI-like enzyme